MIIITRRAPFALPCASSARSGAAAFAQGRDIVSIAMSVKSSTCLISGGEATVAQLEEAGNETCLQCAREDTTTLLPQPANMRGVDPRTIAEIAATTLSNGLANAALGIPVIADDRSIGDSGHVDHYATVDNVQVGARDPESVVAGPEERVPAAVTWSLAPHGGSCDDRYAYFFCDGDLSVPHAAPEAAADGSGAVVRTGEMIEFDVADRRPRQRSDRRGTGGPARRLGTVVSAARRQQRAALPKPGPGRRGGRRLRLLHRVPGRGGAV